MTQTEQDGIYRRRDDRLEVDWVSALDLLEHAEALPCRVANVSTAGTLVRCDQDMTGLILGDEVLLIIEHLGEFAAKIAWLSGPYVGLQILAGPDLLLKSYAEASKTEPVKVE